MYLPNWCSNKVQSNLTELFGGKLHLVTVTGFGDKRLAEPCSWFMMLCVFVQFLHFSAAKFTSQPPLGGYVIFFKHSLLPCILQPPQMIQMWHSMLDMCSKVVHDTVLVTSPPSYVHHGSAVHFPKVQRASCCVKVDWKTTLPLMQPATSWTLAVQRCSVQPVSWRTGEKLFIIVQKQRTCEHVCAFATICLNIRPSSMASLVSTR